MIYKKDKKIIQYITNNWQVFPNKVIYPTDYSSVLVLDLEKSVFIYSLSAISNPIITAINCNSLYFRIYKVGELGIKEAAGYIFVPLIPDKFKLRYTPFMLSITGPNSTKENVLENSERKIIFDSEFLQVLWISCGAEIITDLGNKLNINLE